LSAATARVLVLGTGTSHGVPMIGCECDTCRSTDPHDRRTRASIYIEINGGPSVLVDTSPDLRMQALAYGLKRVDAIVYTHSHADHIMGLDEVRRFNVLQKSAIPCYGDERTLGDLRRIYA
jgi:phosphoribosyl 1,2-cyclic phosphate phosphodiesterase